MRFGGRRSRHLLLAAALALASAGCSMHEFNDPTGATKRVLYERPPAGDARPGAASLIAPVDVVELTNGGRVEGVFQYATASEVAIEANGSVLKLGRGEVRAVHFGRVTP